MSQWISHPTAWRGIHGLIPCTKDGKPNILMLKADLDAARETRNQLQRAHEASQREVTRLRLALVQAEKALR